MFSRKPKPVPDHSHYVPAPSGIVACRDCKHLLYKPDAQVVWYGTIGGCLHSTHGILWKGDTETVRYYCPACRKAYDHVEYNQVTQNVRYFKTMPAVPARQEEVFLDETN